MEIEIRNRADEIAGMDKETLNLLGGLVLVMIGTGMLLSDPRVRRYLSRIDVRGLASTALPDLERLFRAL